MGVKIRHPAINLTAVNSNGEIDVSFKAILQKTEFAAKATIVIMQKIIRKGAGQPSIFNADAVIEEQLNMGKLLEDAREGGCSGCVETGAFGKESYILQGYFNLTKILELTLNNGYDKYSCCHRGFKELLQIKH